MTNFKRLAAAAAIAAASASFASIATPAAAADHRAGYRTARPAKVMAAPRYNAAYVTCTRGRWVWTLWGLEYLNWPNRCY